MELIRGLHNITCQQQACVITIGNFDGLHLGHRYVLAELMQVANTYQLPCAVMIFEPHPIQLLRPDKAPQPISRLAEKLKMFEQLGIDKVVILKFNQYLANCTANAFIEDILVKKLRVQYCLVGNDFRFGQARKGDYQLLAHYAKQFNYHLQAIPPYIMDQHRVSSTLIRASLAEGNIEQAQRWLGRPFMITGKVQYGDGRGRTLGFPTANIKMEHQTKLLPFGVYIVEACLSRGQVFPAIASLGVRPAVVCKGPMLLEVHCLDIPWTNFYGEKMTVKFYQRLREERDFTSPEALVEQMSIDTSQARAYWQKHAMPGIKS